MPYAFRLCAAILALAAVFALCGCGVQKTLKGRYYLNLGQYEEGAQAFAEEVRRSPEDAQAHYYLGRFRLALGHGARALPEFARAVELAPGEADYWFWLGVAHAVGREAEAERRCYEKALAIDPGHLRGLIYMGHNRLEAGAAEKALGFYARALRIWPEAPEPLLNKALILERLGRPGEALAGFKAFLDLYPSGPLALSAASGLNGLGDFSYRNHLLGRRRVTLERIRFAPGTADVAYGSLPNLRVVGAIMENNPRLTLHVVAYRQGDAALARARALAVRERLLQASPGLEPGRIRLSWFGVPEEVQTDGGPFTLPESLNMFAVENG